MNLIAPLSVILAISLAANAFEPDVIIDANDDPANVELSPSGSWTNETSVGNAFRGASKVLLNSASTDFARFHTTLPAEGPWHVYIWHNGGSTSPITATVTHALGSTQVSDSQLIYNPGRWMSLGVFWFNTTADAEVKFTGIASKLSADAVRFSPASPDVILDSNAAGVAASPSANDWGTASTAAGYGMSLRRGTTSGATLTYAPIIPVAGEYEISLWLPPSTGWLPQNGSAATSFTVDVHARGGAVTSHTVAMPNTGTNEGRWVQVGSTPFLLDATPSAMQVVIKTTGVTNEWVPATRFALQRLARTKPMSIMMVQG